MKKGKVAIFLVLFFAFQNTNAQEVRYSPKYFGPNANPVPEFTNAIIPAINTISFSLNRYFGFGDDTKNGFLKIEIPLLPERVSFKVWTTLGEHYETTDAVSLARGIKDGNTSGTANGDIYVQTRILILKEKEIAPNIILNTTLKTASGTKFSQRRYFDTPGYYFDVEFGKSFFTYREYINEVRLVMDLGFLVWETTESVQNDAPMYGGKVIIGNEKWKLENTISGYRGWMNEKDPEYGDVPLVYSAKFTRTIKNVNYFTQIQYGINDFPYYHFQFGASYPIFKSKKVKYE